MHTTIIDLVNQDTLILHNATFTMFYIFFALTFVDHETPSEIPPSILLLFALFFNTVVQICYMYYSIGIAVRYILVRKERTYLSEDYTDKEIQKYIRFTSGSISIAIVCIRATFGEFPQFYFDLVKIDCTDHSGMPIIIFLLLSAIIVNGVCRLLIHVEKKKFDNSKAAKLFNARAVTALFVLTTAVITICVIHINRHSYIEYFNVIQLIWSGIALT